MATTVPNKKIYPSVILLSIGVGLASFIDALDFSVANVCIPYIAGDLAISPNNCTYVITFYIIGQSISFLLANWLMRTQGDVRILSLCLLLFALFSFLCGSSVDIGMLVFFRFFQGLAAGPLFPISQALIMRLVPKENLPLGMALSVSFFLCGLIIGPLVGGLITSYYSWNWIFFINIPVVILAFLVIRSELPPFESIKTKDSLDWIGFACLSICVICFQFILEKGQQWDWVNSNAIRYLFATVCVLLPIAVTRGFFCANPIIDFRFFIKYPIFTLGVVATCVSQAAEIGYTIILPLWSQLYRGYDAFWASMELLPFGVGTLIGCISFALLIRFVNSSRIVVGGFLISSIACFHQSYNTVAQIDVIHFVVSRFFFGLGLAVSFMGMGFIWSNESRDKEEIIHKSTMLLQFFRAISISIGASLLVTLWERRTIKHHFHLAESITPEQPIATQSLHLLEEHGFSHNQSIQTLNQMTNEQAALLSFNDCLLVMSCFLFACLLIYVVWMKILKLEAKP